MTKKELNSGGIKMSQLTELMDELACLLSDLNVIIKEKYIEKQKIKDAVEWLKEEIRECRALDIDKGVVFKSLDIDKGVVLQRIDEAFKKYLGCE